MNNLDNYVQTELNNLIGFSFLNESLTHKKSYVAVIGWGRASLVKFVNRAIRPNYSGKETNDTFLFIDALDLPSKEIINSFSYSEIIFVGTQSLSELKFDISTVSDIQAFHKNFIGTYARIHYTNA